MNTSSKVIISVELQGGLGNQLFQLANAYELSLKYNRLLVISDSNKTYYSTPYWNTIFKKFQPFLVSKEKFKEINKCAVIYNWAMYKFQFKEITLNKNVDVYCIQGYYQSHMYFNMETFKEMLVLNPLHSPKISKYDVAVHIRRTDYLLKNIHKTMSLDYYYNCIYDILKTTNIENIYIFSDDIPWCTNNFKIDIPVHYVSNTDDVDDLSFISKFNTVIIANSSFSWWGAYLGNNTNVYSPKNWFEKTCRLDTSTLRPTYWKIIDDDLKYTTNAENTVHNKDNTVHYKKNAVYNKENVISLGSACCMVHNIHDQLYSTQGNICHKQETATNFFDWLITDFTFISFVFQELVFKDSAFLQNDNFTFNDINSKPSELIGGWSNVYRKLEYKKHKMISLHDVKRELTEIPNEFFEKYERRFNRLYDRITHNTVVHLIHCLDFQWTKPHFPTVTEIESVFKSCTRINPLCKINLYILIHPKYSNEEYNLTIIQHTFSNNVYLYNLKDKGSKSDWKAENLTFNEFFENFFK
jgi:hypothetical protein